MNGAMPKFNGIRAVEGIEHVRGAPNHPMTQGRIERWHRAMKNRVLLENDLLPGDHERQIGNFVDHYNHRRSLHRQATA